GLNRAAAATLLSRFLEASEVPDLKEIELSVDIPSHTETGKVLAAGTVSSKAKLYMNNKEIAQTNGAFRHNVSFNYEEGIHNLEFQAVLPNGRYKSVVKTINFTIPDPRLSIEVPAKTDKQLIKISGEVEDVNDAVPTIQINGVNVSVPSSGKWSSEI